MNVFINLIVVNISQYLSNCQIIHLKYIQLYLSVIPQENWGKKSELMIIAGYVRHVFRRTEKKTCIIHKVTGWGTGINFTLPFPFLYVFIMRHILHARRCKWARVCVCMEFKNNHNGDMHVIIIRNLRSPMNSSPKTVLFCFPGYFPNFNNKYFLALS